MTKEQINNPHHKVTEAERSSIRNTTSQLHWLFNIIRPTTTYPVSNIRKRTTEATIPDIEGTKKIIKFVKAKKGFINFPLLHQAQQLKCSQIPALTNFQMTQVKEDILYF